jgi:exosortase
LRYHSPTGHFRFPSEPSDTPMNVVEVVTPAADPPTAIPSRPSDAGNALASASVAQSRGVPSASRTARWQDPAWIVLVLMVALYWPTVAWLWDRWTMSVWQNAHGLLIAGFVAWLVRDELVRLRDLPASSSGWGFVLLVPALALHVLDTGMHTQLLSAAALFLALPGVSLLFLGKERTRAIAFPLVLLFLTLPIPLVFTEGLHLFLRKIATAGTAFFVPMLGIPLWVEGTALHVPAGTLLVADACSGFSTLYASIVVACLVAYHCRDPRRRATVLLLATPIAIAANIVRMLILVVAVQWQGLEVLDTPWHPISGMFTFVLALPLIVWLGRNPRPAEAPKP